MAAVCCADLVIETSHAWSQLRWLGAAVIPGFGGKGGVCGGAKAGCLCRELERGSSRPGVAGCELDAGARDASDARAGSDELGRELLAGPCSEGAGSSAICIRQPCCLRTMTLPSNACRQDDFCFRRSAASPT